MLEISQYPKKLQPVKVSDFNITFENITSSDFNNPQFRDDLLANPEVLTSLIAYLTAQGPTKSVELSMARSLKKTLDVELQRQLAKIANSYTSKVIISAGGVVINTQKVSQ